MEHVHFGTFCRYNSYISLCTEVSHKYVITRNNQKISTQHNVKSGISVLYTSRNVYVNMNELN